MSKKPSTPRVWISFEFLDDPDFSNSHLLVYGYLLNRYNFFKHIRKQFFENISDIAAATRQSPATVKRVLKDLQEKEYLQIGKVKTATGHSNNYVVMDKHKMSNQANQSNQSSTSTKDTRTESSYPSSYHADEFDQIDDPF